MVAGGGGGGTLSAPILNADLHGYDSYLQSSCAILVSCKNHTHLSSFYIACGYGSLQGLKTFKVLRHFFVFFKSVVKVLLV